MDIAACLDGLGLGQYARLAAAIPPRRSSALQSKHRSTSALDAAVILLKSVVHVATCPMPHIAAELCPDCPGIGIVAVRGDPIRGYAGHRFCRSKEGLGGGKRSEHPGFQTGEPVPCEPFWRKIGRGGFFGCQPVRRKARSPGQRLQVQGSLPTRRGAVTAGSDRWLDGALCTIRLGTDGLHDSPLEQAGLELLVPVSAARARKMRRVQTDPDQMTEQGRELVAIGLG